MPGTERRLDGCGPAALAALAATLTLAVVLVALALGPAAARAQGPAYPATPPTKGALYVDGQDGRYLLGGAWLMRLDPGNVGLAQGFWRNVASTDGWTPVTVPNSYNANDLSSASMAGYVGWYRRDFTLPAHAFARYVKKRDRHWILRFESVNYSAEVWLNGHEVGTHSGAYLPFEFDLHNLRPGVNRLIVRVDNQRTGADFPQGPGGGWWNFGGIQREVYLRAVQRVDLPQVVVRPLLHCPTCSATIEEQALVRNLTGASQTVTVRGSYGGKHLTLGTHTIPAHGTWTASGSVVLRHPHLWSIDDPHLYRATITAFDSAGQRLSRYTVQSGVRSITVTRSGRLELNGRLLNLRGVNLHEQVAGQGNVLQPAQIQRLMGWVQGVGAKLVRAHYPLNPYFEQLADQDGILLWSEVPVYQSSSSYYGNASWLAAAHDLLRQNILTNQNHPSILLWSIGNELQTPPPASEGRYIAGQVKLAHSLDPTRPVGMALSNWPGVACQSAYAPLDVLGFNEYFGVFDAGGGSNDDRDALAPYLSSLRACYPNQAIMISEFGYEGNRDGPVDEKGTYENAENNMAFTLNVFNQTPWLSGAIWFALQDFAARPGWTGGDPLGDPPYVQKGVVDILGNIKPQWGTMQSMYDATVQIASTVSAGTRRAASTRDRRGASTRTGRGAGTGPLGT